MPSGIGRRSSAADRDHVRNVAKGPTLPVFMRQLVSRESGAEPAHSALRTFHRLMVDSESGSTWVSRRQASPDTTRVRESRGSREDHGSSTSTGACPGWTRSKSRRSGEKHASPCATKRDRVPPRHSGESADNYGPGKSAGRPQNREPGRHHKIRDRTRGNRSANRLRDGFGWPRKTL
jgi:hypothetical protein